MKEIEVIKIGYDFTTEKPYRAYATLKNGKEVHLNRFDPESEDTLNEKEWGKIKLTIDGENFTNEPEFYAFCVKLKDLEDS